MSPGPRIGVLALQGDVREHVRALEAVGATTVPVKREAELHGIQGIVVPGGESTVIDKLLRAFELFEPLRDRLRGGLPAYGSCAGMILLADRVTDATADQQTLGGIDMTVRRNAFGRQVDSFEQDVRYAAWPAPVRAVFIRAPWVEQVGESVEVLARVEGGRADGRIVAVRQGGLLATSFHPEVTGDVRVHAQFVEMVRERS
ncbi:MAG: pyridoxal 5'-phosphate synthase glutaminase subunit PdxT [Actinomycetales bacterium]|nr:pyridoxal 5'-phosphate synthase glutaminase subunit PdxT [Candidatus Phosphoribacter baldrii]MBK7610331.1 pyridoxal 5'-phosphate synthase glutaminase subunit PdxT [Candidatus Phosphoribacter baldrii]HRC13744.1 pyridoxal 5'-phosphate synthase glutaminase subunit PdxT [Dermatophilaceae bacterium]